jgi:hypothetical protein
MAITLSVAARNAKLDALEVLIGTSAILLIRTGAAPSNVGASSTGTVLATLSLPSDYMAAASGGAKAMSGTWSDASADATGTAAHYELTASGGTVHLRGSVGTSGADLNVNNTSFAATQAFSITSYTWTEGNAGS